MICPGCNKPIEPNRAVVFPKAIDHNSFDTFCHLCVRFYPEYGGTVIHDAGCWWFYRRDLTSCGYLHADEALAELIREAEERP